MEDKEPKKKIHCLVLPFPVHGHINPMLQFAKCLLRKNISVTLILTKNVAGTISLPSDSIISLRTISDGFDETMPSDAPPGVYLSKFKEIGSSTLREVIRSCPSDCLIYDPILQWSLAVAKEMNLATAAFFTQSCAVDRIYESFYTGDLKLPLPEKKVILIPGLPPLEPRDMPSFIYTHGSYPLIFEMLVNQFMDLEKADWLFFNTFYKLEEEVIDYMSKFAAVKAIGPSMPSMFLENRREYEPATDACMDWLNEQDSESVIYVSFGSIAKLNERQTEELAWGLKSSNKRFLWVVRSSEQSKLPQGFVEETSSKGLIVPWCSQLDVLSHAAVCCFVTHCGWNSTLEALSLGVPMVAMPQWTDQATNAKFVVDVWKVGVRAEVDGDGVVCWETIARCIKEVVEGGGREEMRKNAIKWKELAREAMDEGGSSVKNIDAFVDCLVSK